MQEPEGFHEFVQARSPALVRSAWLLTGDWAIAEDLVQTSLAKTWPKWERACGDGAPELYVRRVMHNTYASWWRRKWRHEISTGQLPDHSRLGDDYEQVEVRVMVQDALHGLPAGQRATVILRYLDDLTEAQTADVLGCSVGTVKSQTARALAHLRRFPSFQDITIGGESS